MHDHTGACEDDDGNDLADQLVSAAQVPPIVDYADAADENRGTSQAEPLLGLLEKSPTPPTSVCQKHERDGGQARPNKDRDPTGHSEIDVSMQLAALIGLIGKSVSARQGAGQRRQDKAKCEAQGEECKKRPHGRDLSHIRDQAWRGRWTHSRGRSKGTLPHTLAVRQFLDQVVNGRPIERRVFIGDVLDHVELVEHGIALLRA